MEGLFRGTWYRSAVKLEGETIIPIPPFVSYNPFDFYHPASELRQGQKSLYLELLAVDADKPEEIVKFCERFGVLGNSLELLKSRMGELRKKPDWPNFLSRLLPRLSDKERQYLDALRLGRVEQSDFHPNELCIPMPIKIFKQIQNSLGGVVSPSSSGITSNHSQGNYKPDRIKKLINMSLESCRVRQRIDWNIQKNQWELVWSSLELTGFLYVMGMLDFMGPGKTLCCPRCGKIFMTASNRVTYCSAACYENFKVQKYQRKKKELAAQKGKKAKTTKSTRKNK